MCIMSRLHLITGHAAFLDSYHSLISNKVCPGIVYLNCVLGGLLSHIFAFFFIYLTTKHYKRKNDGTEWRSVAQRVSDSREIFGKGKNWKVSMYEANVACNEVNLQTYRSSALVFWHSLVIYKQTVQVHARICELASFTSQRVQHVRCVYKQLMDVWLGPSSSAITQRQDWAYDFGSTSWMLMKSWSTALRNSRAFALKSFGNEYEDTVRWSNFDRRDPKMGVFLQSTEATSCGHLLKRKRAHIGLVLLFES